MRQYVYGYDLRAEDGEVFFSFPRFPEIISAVDAATFQTMRADAVAGHAYDAALTALQAVITLREEVPAVDDPGVIRADGFVHLPVTQSMKLELYRVYRANCRSVADFADRLGKSETAARRLLNLRHASRTGEIEQAVALFGKRLVHAWSLESAPGRAVARRVRRSRVPA